MNVIQWNCRGYHSNYEDILSLIHNFRPYSIALQETMQARPLKSPRNYHIYSQNDQRSTAGQGLAILVRNDIASNQIQISTNLNAHAVTVHLHRTVTICNLYVPPHHQLALRDLENLVSQLPTPFLLMGDFNARHSLWGDTGENHNGRVIFDYLSNTDHTLMNDLTGTRFDIRTGNSSNLDLSICSPSLSLEFAWRVSDELLGSDHFPIIISHQTESPPHQERFNIKRADWNLYRILSDSPISNDLSIDDTLEQIEQTIVRAASSSIPRTKRTNHKPIPWWNEACEATRKLKKAALRKYQRTKNPQDKIDLKRARAVARYTVKQSKKSEWQHFVSTFNSETPLNLIYSRINKINGNRSNHATPCIIVNNNQLHHPKEVANAIGDHFAQISSKSRLSPSLRQAESVHLDFSTQESHPYNDAFSLLEFNNSLRKCRNTAPGPDSIHYEMIKNLSPNMKNQILNFLNRCWLSGKFPQRWTTATVLAFPKPNKPPSLPSSYRPIALTCTLCKVMEKMVNHRLYYVLENQQLLNKFQYGFRKMRGTEDSLVWLESQVLRAFSHGKHLVGIFFDVEKAYDTVWKFGILRKLHTAGIRGSLALFIQNFLSDRHFRVKIQNFYSDPKPQEEGVPQGSVLSCLLFNLAINDIANGIPQHVQPSLYVDDLAIFIEVTYIDSAERSLQSAVNVIAENASKNGFKISFDKTTGVIFHRKRMVNPPNIKLYNRTIQFRNEVKFLGLTLDSRLTWLPHITNLRNRALKAANILKILSHLRWGADRLTLFRIYRAIIRTKMDYGCQLYDTAKESVLYKLSVVHHICIRLCTGAFKSSPIKSLYSESGEPALQYRRDQLSLQHFTRIKRLKDSRTCAAVVRDFDRPITPPPRPNTPQPFGTRVKILLNKYEIPNGNVYPYNILEIPIWRTRIDVCKELRQVKKNENPEATLKSYYLDHLTEKHSCSLKIFTDGSKCNSGAAFAVVANQTVIERTRMPNESTIHSCELSAIEAALNYASLQSPCEITVATDSLSSIQSIEDSQSNHPIVLNIYSRLHELQNRGFRIWLCWVPSHVGIQGNELADRAAFTATTNGPIPLTPLPYRDYYPKIKQKIREKWEEEWVAITNNKLREVKTTTKPWITAHSSNRTHEVSLCRLRIGHTLYTQQYLMERREQPICEVCNTPLTVKHILSHCPEYALERERIYGNREVPLPIILSESAEFKSDKLFSFLINIGLFNKI